MPKRKRFRERLSYANVMSTVAVFIALGGGAYAAKQLPKNSVGPKQLRKNAVTKVKLRKNSVVTAKIGGNAVTGAKVNESTLGTVPAAQTAATASTASTASIANALAPPEAWHEVGTPGEPGFQNGWGNAETKVPPPPEGAGFFKDHEGIVHLKGIVSGPTEGTAIFQLPDGFRPAAGRFISPAGGELRIYGSGTAQNGALIAPATKLISLDGTTFRAES
jgi:hypothetical protein